MANPPRAFWIFDKLFSNPPCVHASRKSRFQEVPQVVAETKGSAVSIVIVIDLYNSKNMLNESHCCQDLPSGLLRSQNEVT